MKPNILVLCTGNSCRSQMAEGFLRALAGDRFEIYSAGTVPRPEVHPLAVQVMGEAGIDISGQRPHSVTEYLGRLMVRYLIFVCDDADRQCPSIFPGHGERLLWPFDDPAAFEGTAQQRLDEFRRVRDEIKSRIVAWLA